MVGPSGRHGINGRRQRRRRRHRSFGRPHPSGTKSPKPIDIHLRRCRENQKVNGPPSCLGLIQSINQALFYEWIGRSLLMWRHGASKQLYVMLWLLLPVSLVVSSSYIFTLAGYYLVLKLFVVDFIFMRFPRLRQKYDTTAQIWIELPTDADLDALRRRTEQVSIRWPQNHH